MTLESDIHAAVAGLTTDLQLNAFKVALIAGAKIAESAYRNILLGVAKPPGGPNFLQAHQAVGSKVVVTESGAYAVIGTKRSGGHRLAPQVLFDEKGTDERYTKSGAYRGKVLPQGWLITALAQSSDQIKEVMLAKLKAYAAKY